MLHQQVKFLSACESCAVVQMVAKFKWCFFPILNYEFNIYLFFKNRLRQLLERGASLKEYCRIKILKETQQARCLLGSRHSPLCGFLVPTLQVVTTLKTHKYQIMYEASACKCINWRLYFVGDQLCRDEKEGML